jgi:hypothetical protein
VQPSTPLGPDQVNVLLLLLLLLLLFGVVTATVLVVWSKLSVVVQKIAMTGWSIRYQAIVQEHADWVQHTDSARYGRSDGSIQRVELVFEHLYTYACCAQATKQREAARPS